MVSCQPSAVRGQLSAVVTHKGIETNLDVKSTQRTLGDFQSTDPTIVETAPLNEDIRVIFINGHLTTDIEIKCESALSLQRHLDRAMAIVSPHFVGLEF